MKYNKTYFIILAPDKAHIKYCNYRRYILASKVFALFIILVQSAHTHLYQDQFKHNRHDDESPDMFVKSYIILD